MTGVRWEYRAEVRGGPVPLAWLNELGAEGWEVVGWEPSYDPTTGSVQAQHGRVWLFKRARVEVPVGSIERMFQEFKAQNPGVPAALMSIPESDEQTTAVAEQLAQETDVLMQEKPKRNISPEHLAKMREARWGKKDQLIPASEPVPAEP